MIFDSILFLCFVLREAISSERVDGQTSRWLHIGCNYQKE